MSRQTRRMPAPCRLDPDGWFPEGVAGVAARSQMQEAASICQTMCSIREACLKLAMAAEGNTDAKGRFGVFGGLIPAERANLAKRQRRAELRAAGQELAA